MKKIIVSLVCSVLASLFSQAAVATEPVCEEIKKCQAEVCEMVKACTPATKADDKPKVIWREEYVCSGNYDPLKSKNGGKCVCKEPDKYHPYSLSRAWEEDTNRVDPSNPNVKYHRLYVRCDLSARAVLEATQHTMNIQQQDIVDLTERVSKIEGVAADHEVRIGKLEANDVEQDKKLGELDTYKATKLEVSKKADKADLDKKADTEWVKKWVNAHRVHFTATGGVAYAAIPGSSMGFGVMDVSLGGLFGEGDIGLDVGGRFMFSPGGLNSSTYPNSKSGQTYGVGVYSRITIALSDDKRTRLGLGGSYTQFGRFNDNAERLGAITGADVSITVPLSDQVVVVPFGTLGSAMTGDGAARKTGLGGMLGVTLGVTF